MQIRIALPQPIPLSFVLIAENSKGGNGFYLTKTCRLVQIHGSLDNFILEDVVDNPATFQFPQIPANSGRKTTHLLRCVRSVHRKSVAPIRSRDFKRRSLNVSNSSLDVFFRKPLLGQRIPYLLRVIKEV